MAGKKAKTKLGRERPYLNELLADEQDVRVAQGGLIALAKQGDRESIQELCWIGETIANFITDDSYAEVAKWLAGCLLQVRRGVEPNVAFGWNKQGKRGRPKLFSTAYRDYTLAVEALSMIQDGRAKSEGEAVQMIAKEYNVSTRTVREALYQMPPDWRVPRPFGWQPPKK